MYAVYVSFVVVYFISFLKFFLYPIEKRKKKHFLFLWNKNIFLCDGKWILIFNNKENKKMFCYVCNWEIKDFLFNIFNQKYVVIFTHVLISICTMWVLLFLFLFLSCSYLFMLFIPFGLSTVFWLFVERLASQFTAKVVLGKRCMGSTMGLREVELNEQLILLQMEKRKLGQQQQEQQLMVRQMVTGQQLVRQQVVQELQPVLRWHD